MGSLSFSTGNSLQSMITRVDGPFLKFREQRKQYHDVMFLDNDHKFTVCMHDKSELHLSHVHRKQVSINVIKKGPHDDIESIT